MSYLRVCLVAFLVLGIVVAGSADINEDNGDCDQEVKPGSSDTQLLPFEQIAKDILSSIGENTVKSNTNGQNSDTKPKKSSSLYGDVLNRLNEIPQFTSIPPGMLWCGSGNRSKSYEDLGFFKYTDACCRSHDACPEDIAAGKTLKNLYNNGIFTRSSCTCDTEFYNCLKNISLIHKIPNPVADSIGKMYFDILQPQCFRCICPANSTVHNDTESNNCTKYEWVNNSMF